MSNFSINSRIGDDILAQLRDMQSEAQGKPSQSLGGEKSGGMSFVDHLKSSIQEVDSMQKTADKMAADVASGQSQNLHEVMLKSTEAQLAFDLMVQLRNKALEAYSEIMRMPV